MYSTTKQIASAGSASKLSAAMRPSSGVYPGSGVPSGGQNPAVKSLIGAVKGGSNPAATAKRFTSGAGTTPAQSSQPQATATSQVPAKPGYRWASKWTGTAWIRVQVPVGTAAWHKDASGHWVHGAAPGTAPGGSGAQPGAPGGGKAFNYKDAMYYQQLNQSNFERAGEVNPLLSQLAQLTADVDKSKAGVQTLYDINKATDSRQLDAERYATGASLAGRGMYNSGAQNRAINYDWAQKYSNAMLGLDRQYGTQARRQLKQDVSSKNQQYDTYNAGLLADAAQRKQERGGSPVGSTPASTPAQPKSPAPGGGKGAKTYRDKNGVVREVGTGREIKAPATRKSSAGKYVKNGNVYERSSGRFLWKAAK